MWGCVGGGVVLGQRVGSGGGSESYCLAFLGVSIPKSQVGPGRLPVGPR